MVLFGHSISPMGFGQAWAAAALRSISLFASGLTHMAILCSNLRMKNAHKRPTNISLPVAIVDEAKELGINISQACEKGVVAEISVRRRERWIEENWDAIQSSNAWVEKHGLPLAKHRMF
jgi:antitoxin CcdA